MLEIVEEIEEISELIFKAFSLLFQKEGEEVSSSNSDNLDFNLGRSKTPP